MGAIASQITSLTIVYPTVYSDADQRKHQSSASLAFVRGVHRGPVNSPHESPVTRKMFPSDDVIMEILAVAVLARCRDSPQVIQQFNQENHGYNHGIMSCYLLILANKRVHGVKAVLFLIFMLLIQNGIFQHPNASHALCDRKHDDPLSPRYGYCTAILGPLLRVLLPGIAVNSTR